MRIKMRSLSLAFLPCCLMSVTSAADDLHPSSTVNSVAHRLPSSVVPSRYYTSAASTVATNPVPATPEPEITYTTASPSAATQQAVSDPTPIHYRPVEQPDVGPATPQPKSPPPSVLPAPPPTMPVATQTPALHAEAPSIVATAEQEKHEYRNTTPVHSNKYDFSVGVEGFSSHYHEDFDSRDTIGPFGSVTADYTRHFNPRWYGSLDLRGSYGVARDSSSAGITKDIPQWETDDRILIGYISTLSSESRLKTYFGFGGRYFSDHGKGLVSDLGENAFDQRIMQFYVPLGVTYEYTSNGFTFAPNLEIDPAFWGNVSSRLGNIDGFENIENHQSRGIGVRSELMMGYTGPRGLGWRFGPFVRFWYFPSSNTVVDSSGTPWIQPENTRLQMGAAFKYLF